MGGKDVPSRASAKGVYQSTAIEGVRFATAEAGIRYKNRKDVVLFAFDAGTQIAGVFTKSNAHPRR